MSHPQNDGDARVLLSEFDREARQKVSRDTRTGAIAACMFVPFGILDYFAFPHLFITFLLIRVAVVAISMVVFLFTRSRLGTSHPFFLGMLEFLIGGLSIVLMVHLSGGYTSTYYAGITWSCLRSFSFSR